MTAQDFAGQRICVVGGTAGIGLAIARRVAAGGGALVVAGRDLQRAQASAAHLGRAAIGLAVDVDRPDAIETFFKDLGAIDHLVTTAGKVMPGPFKTGFIEDARASMASKFWSQYLCARHAEVKRSILLVSGTLSRNPMSGTAALGAVNGAVEALGRSLALELAPVRVNVLSPGLVRGTEAFAAMPASDREAMFTSMAKALPAGLVGDPDSVAIVAAALLASPYATGAVVDVDGGGLIA